MPRPRTGSLYFSHGHWFVALTLEKRTHFDLGPCSEEEARLRQTFLSDIANRLKSANKLEFAEALCRQAAYARQPMLDGVLKLVDGVIAGTERRNHAPGAAFEADPFITVGEFGTRWTTNALARQFRLRVREIDHTSNISRLKEHVYPVTFRGRLIRDTPLVEFTLDHAEHILARSALPDGSVRHVAQLLHRLFRLAVFPARLLAHSPLPPGWVPGPSPAKERSYLFPSEDAAFLATTLIPLPRRLLVGFGNREGPRKENAVTIQWSNLTLDGLPDGGGYIVLDLTKNGRGGAWALDPGTAEALRRWRKICPSTQFVFPAEAMPRHRRRCVGVPMYVDHLATELRDGLRQAGVTRPKLYEKGPNRLPLRAHDLRATFVTIALANGRSEDWVATRTGHRSTAMIARYRREAKTAQELKLGWFTPLHEAIPELASVGTSSKANGLSHGTEAAP